MADDNRTQLKTQLRQAYALIKADRRAEAYEMLTPVLAQQPDNVDAWWLAAHAAPTAHDAAFACQKVLALRPGHLPARQMLEEQHRRMAVERPVQFKPVRRPRRGIRPWRLLLLAAIPALLVGALLIAINVTGNNFGLPVGHFFSAAYEIPNLGLIGNDRLNDPDALVLRSGTLVIGAEHTYSFFVPTDNVIFFSLVRFTLLGGVSPGDAIKLIGPDGRAVALSIGEDGRGGAVPFTTMLPVRGRYTFKLTGTAGRAQGPYVLQMAVATFGLE